MFHQVFMITVYHIKNTFYLMKFLCLYFSIFNNLYLTHGILSLHFKLYDLYFFINKKTFLFFYLESAFTQIKQIKKADLSRPHKIIYLISCLSSTTSFPSK